MDLADSITECFVCREVMLVRLVHIVKVNVTADSPELLVSQRAV